MPITFHKINVYVKDNDVSKYLTSDAIEENDMNVMKNMKKQNEFNILLIQKILIQLVVMMNI